MDEQLPTPREPPPSWIDLDIETDLDVLLNTCFADIQTTLSTWAMITGPRLSSSSASSHPLSNDESADTFQILPLLQTVTTMLSSVRNYTVHRHDLSNNAVNKLRYASLNLLESMKELENQHRVEEEMEDDENEAGFLYRSSDFELLKKERLAIHKYLEEVETHAFNPPHHIGSPPAMFTPEIQALMGKTSILSLTESELNDELKQKEKGLSATNKKTSGVPSWLERGSFVNDPLGKISLEGDVETRELNWYSIYRKILCSFIRQSG